jgi:hypothetical protein
LKKRLYLLSKGYTCRFKSEAFASFASIALRPWLRVYRIGKFLLKLRPMEKTIDLTQIIITLYYCNLHELLSSTPCYLQVRIKLTTLPMIFASLYSDPSYGRGNCNIVESGVQEQ